MLSALLATLTLSGTPLIGVAIPQSWHYFSLTLILTKVDDPEARLCAPSLLKSALVCQSIRKATVVS